MNQKIALAFAIQLFEEDTFDDLFIIACNKLGAYFWHIYFWQIFSFFGTTKTELSESRVKFIKLI